MIDAKRILVVAPHPDDEVLGCGGTLSLCTGRGAHVHVLIVFDGAAGDPQGKFESADYVARRQREAEAGGRSLGLTNYTFWGLPEGHLASSEELDQGAERLAELVARLQPELVLAPWVGDGHRDHRTVAEAVSRWLSLAEGGGREMGIDVWGYEVWSELPPDQLVDVSGVWPRKVEALEQHQSQLAYADLLAQMRCMAQRDGSGQYERFQRWEPVS